jgi:hypothetical protein
MVPLAVALADSVAADEEAAAAIVVVPAGMPVPVMVRRRLRARRTSRPGR